MLTASFVTSGSRNPLDALAVVAVEPGDLQQHIPVDGAPNLGCAAVGSSWPGLPVSTMRVTVATSWAKAIPG